MKTLLRRKLFDYSIREYFMNNLKAIIVSVFCRCFKASRCSRRFKPSNRDKQWEIAKDKLMKSMDVSILIKAKNTVKMLKTVTLSKY